jgi:hypothetical protein
LSQSLTTIERRLQSQQRAARPLGNTMLSPLCRILLSTVCLVLVAGFPAGSVLALQGSPPSHLTGQVLDLDKTPVQGMTMVATSTTSGAKFTAVTGEDGRFLIIVMAVWEYEVTGHYQTPGQGAVAIPGKQQSWSSRPCRARSWRCPRIPFPARSGRSA